MLASPSIALFAKLPNSEPFSYIYLLGPNHTTQNIPFNIYSRTKYSIYVGVGNQMSSSEYYICYVKLGNEDGPLPDVTLGTPSPLPILFEYRSFIENGQTWEAPLTFQIDNLNFSETNCQLNGITINGLNYPVSVSSAYDSNSTGYYYALIVELWLYNSTTGTAMYNNRYVSLYLNMTQ